MIAFSKRKGSKSKKGVKVATSPPQIVSKNLANAITVLSKKAFKKELETKYRAEYIVNNQLVTAGAAVPANLARMLPGIAAGTGDSERVGDRIEPIKGKCDVTVHFQATPSGGANGPYSDVEVHILFLAVKGAKNAAQVATTPVGTLLRNGLGGNFDPTVGSAPQTDFLENINLCPVNTDQFTVLKRMSHRFAKGDYDINGPASGSGGTQKSMMSPKHTFTYSWKPPALEYNATVDTFPTNHYPVYIMWLTTLDGGPYGGNVYYGTRSELWYKDA